MLIRLLCAHEMTKHVCKISRLNSERLLRKPNKILGGYFILPNPVVLTSNVQPSTKSYQLQERGEGVKKPPDKGSTHGSRWGLRLYPPVIGFMAG